MANNYFYSGTLRKYVALFGYLFDKMRIERRGASGELVQQMVIPVGYGPYQKFLARLEQDPQLQRSVAVVLPRMAFEILGVSYTPERKLNSLKKVLVGTDETGRSFQYVPAPYDIDFALYVMCKYADDGAQIIEQILPFYKPERTVSVELIPGLEPLDIPVTLTSVSMEDLYEDAFAQRRSIVWTLNFTLKGYFFGPVREREVIKFVDTRFFDSLPKPDLAPVKRITTDRKSVV